MSPDTVSALLGEVRVTAQTVTVVFVCAKVLGWNPVDSWSWWAVLSPLIACLCLAALGIAGALWFMKKNPVKPTAPMGQRSKS
jgi:protein-S-isoprenylcysteine O-methyltransferase Ste14